MDYPRPYDTVYRRQLITAVKHYSINESTCVISDSRVNDHARRLIHDKQILVLIHYIERYVLRQNIQRFRFGQFDRQTVAGAQLVIFSQLFTPFYAHISGLYELLKPAARHIMQF